MTPGTILRSAAVCAGLLANGTQPVHAAPEIHVTLQTASARQAPAQGQALAPGSGQQPDAGSRGVLHGVVVGADGNVVAGVPIALHRVVDTGGAMVEEVGSDSIGRFTIHVGADEPADALYFVAARFEGELYIGPSFRPPFPEGAEYVVQVGIAATNASRLARGVDPDGVFVRPPASPWRWGIALAVAVALIGFIVAIVIRARGPDTRRRLLIRVAELDEAHAAEHGAAAGGAGWDDTDAAPDAADGDGDAAHNDYLARRDELIEQIRALR